MWNLRNRSCNSLEFGKDSRGRANEFFSPSNQIVLLLEKMLTIKEEFYTYFPSVGQLRTNIFLTTKKTMPIWAMYGLGLADEVLKKSLLQKMPSDLPGNG